MPTKPLESLLYREFQKMAGKDIIDIASPLLQELVNYSTNAFVRCESSAIGGDENLPIFACHLHVIEMTDGIEALISQSCPVPSIPLLRSSFEALLAIEYILETDYKRRAYAWLVDYIHQRLMQYEMLDPSKQRGKEFLNTLASDEVGKRLKLEPPTNLPKAIKNLRSVLDEADYQEAEIEYQKLPKTEKRLNWYRLFGGPPNLRELSIYLNKGAQYDLLYRYWSRITHTADLSCHLTKTKKGSTAWSPLRNHKEIKDVSSLAASLLLEATQKLLEKFRSGEKVNFARWYKREVRYKYLGLLSNDQR